MQTFQVILDVIVLLALGGIWWVLNQMLAWHKTEMADLHKLYEHVIHLQSKQPDVVKN